MEDSLALHLAQERAMAIAAERKRPVWIHDQPGSHLFGIALDPAMVPAGAQYRQKVLPPLKPERNG